MSADIRISRQAVYSKYATILLVMLLFLVSFGNELLLIWQLIISWGYVYILRAGDAVYVSPEASRASLLVFANMSVFALFFFIVLFWVSPFTLPVRGLAQTRNAFAGLVRYTLAGRKLHGPAIFVKEGKPEFEENELSSFKAGVALVDLYSAIVLEQQTGSVDALRQDLHFEAESEEDEAQRPRKLGVWKQAAA